MTDTNVTPARGVLPKNLQTWVLIGITLLVVAVIALGGTGTKAKTQAAGGSAPTALGAAPMAPQVPLEQYEARLAQMKADAERAQQEALTAQGLLTAQPPTPPPGMGTLVGAPGATTGEDEVHKRQVEREYSSLFASQLARSYRADKAGTTPAPRSSEPAPPSSPAATETAGAPARDPRLAELDGLRQSLDTQQQQLLEALRPTPPPVATPAQPRRPATTGRNETLPDAQRYALLEGSVLETTLLTRLNSDFSGPVVAQTSAPTYTRNLQHVLIPAGSRVIGEAKRTEAFGQTRLVVVFHRLLMPDGYSVDLDQFAGISPRGESALSDDVNHHYVQIFGTSIALGMLGGLSSVGASPTNPTTLDQFRLGASSSFGQSATHVLDKFTNILPTITIREGHRVRVWIAQDLALPAYDAHAMPKDL